MYNCVDSLKESGDVNAISLGNSVCIAKAAARMILKESGGQAFDTD